jgi:hypothetical protein
VTFDETAPCPRGVI